jgi:hypothetical protein
VQDNALYSTIYCSAVQDNILYYSAILCKTMYYTVQCSTGQCTTLQYNIVQYNAISVRLQDSGVRIILIAEWGEMWLLEIKKFPVVSSFSNSKRIPALRSRFISKIIGPIDNQFSFQVHSHVQIYRLKWQRWKRIRL